MQKVVINRCYGGFGLSPMAIERYNAKSGKNTYWYAFPSDSSQYAVKVEDPRILEYKDMTPLNKDIGASVNYLDLSRSDAKLSIYNLKRDDKYLVEVVEELGSLANARCSNLKVVSIPDGVEWGIEEYDGLECVSEVHRVWTGEEEDDEE